MEQASHYKKLLYCLSIFVTPLSFILSTHVAQKIVDDFTQNSCKITEEITGIETARINKIKAEKKMLIDSLQRDKVQVEKLVCDAENAKSRALKVQELSSMCKGFLSFTNASEVASHFKRFSQEMNQTLCEVLNDQGNSSSPQTISLTAGFAAGPGVDTLGALTRENITI